MTIMTDLGEAHLVQRAKEQQVNKSMDSVPADQAKNWRTSMVLWDRKFALDQISLLYSHYLVEKDRGYTTD